MKETTTKLLMLLILSLFFCEAEAHNFKSPNGKISASITGNTIDVLHQGEKVVTITIGVNTTSINLTDDITLSSTSKAKRIDESYTMLTGKRSHCVNHANEVIVTYTNPAGNTLFTSIRIYNDGIALRYEVQNMPETDKIIADNTTYTVESGTPRWMQEYDRQGYEHFYPMNGDGINPDKPTDRTWGFPALFNTGKEEGAWMLLTEADIRRGDCGSWLTNKKSADTYQQHLADHIINNTTPWRLAIIGNLEDVVESTLVTDVSTPCKLTDTSWIEPGIASWIYWAHNHGSQDYKLLCQYADLAKEMGWKYTLIDAEWDVMKNGGNLQDVINYSNSLGVKPLLWYNSSTNWTGKWAPTPQFLLNKPEDRKAEYKKATAMGLHGLKIDFFPGDKQETMDYYLDLLEDAIPNHLSINFHGATIPRGWSRTYPHLMSTEAVYGAEWYNNAPTLTNRAARHNATLPFTRNVIGPMDYTPGTFSDSQHPHITTHAHELALTILFESGIQHMPDRPEAYRSLPKEVRDLLSTLPSAWDETRLLSGFPGEWVVMARRKGNTWYIAGINGMDSAETLLFSPEKILGKKAQALYITDGLSQTIFNISKAEMNMKSLQEIRCAARGGFVIKIEQ